jgi:5-methylcytosine-specific restriction endonuclease McrA
MWSRFDDDYSENKKIRRVSLEAMSMHTAAILHCSKGETDGFFPKGDLELVAAKAKVPARKAQATVRELIDANLVHDRGDQYEVHDYLDYNPSHAELAEKRRVATERSGLRADAALMGRIKARDGSTCRYCGTDVDWSDRRGAKGGTYDHVVPVSRGGSTAYSNLVVSCRGCNSKKCDMTPEEAGMELSETGKRPGSLPVKCVASAEHNQEHNPVTRSPIPIPRSEPEFQKENTPTGSGGRSDGLGKTRPRTPSDLIHCLRIAVEREQPANGFWNPGGPFAPKNADGFLAGFADLEAALSEIEVRIEIFAKDASMRPWTVEKFAKVYNALGARPASTLLPSKESRDRIIADVERRESERRRVAGQKGS